MRASSAAKFPTGATSTARSPCVNSQLGNSGPQPFASYVVAHPRTSMLTAKLWCRTERLFRPGVSLPCRLFEFNFHLTIFAQSQPADHLLFTSEQPVVARAGLEKRGGD